MRERVCGNGVSLHNRHSTVPSGLASSARALCVASEFPQAPPQLPPPRAASTRFETGTARRRRWVHASGANPASPAGTTENSPPFQRWATDSKTRSSPAGAKETGSQVARCVRSSVPVGTCSSCARKPSDKSLGYCLSPYGLGHTRPCQTRNRPVPQSRRDDRK